MSNSLTALFGRIFGIEIVLKLLSGVVSILIARNLDEEEYSVIVFLLLVINLSVNISSGYYNKYIFIVDNRQSFIQNELGEIKTLLRLFSVLLFCAIYGFSSGEYSELLFVGCTIVLVRLSYTFIQSKLQFAEKFKQYYRNEVIRTTLYSFPVLVYLNSVSKAEARIIIYFLLFSFLVLFLSKYLKNGSYYTFKFSSNIFDIIRVDILGFVVFLSFISALDLLVIEYFDDSGDLATYGAAVTLYSFLILGLSSVHRILLPKISSGTKYDIKRNLYDLNKISLILIVVYIVCLPFSKSMFVLLYGVDKFENAYLIFDILALSAVFSFVLSPYINILNRIGDFGFLFKISSVVMVLMIPCHFLGYLLYGTIGVACTTLLGNVSFNLLVAIKARKSLGSLV